MRPKRARGLVCLAAVLTLVALVPSAGAADDDVFGFKLGAPLPLQECARRGADYELFTRTVCYKRIGAAAGFASDRGSGKVTVQFPAAEAPMLVSGGSFNATIVDGNLESVEFATSGIQATERVMSVLVEKYGEPTTLQPRKVQNRLGATFDTYLALWSLEGLSILYSPVLGSLDMGLVIISTPKGSEQDKLERERRRSRDPRPL